jgi:uncharacterized oligopeptide transporter (OPT) family protein
MAPKFVFCTIYCVRNGPLRQCFWSCIALLALGILLWLIIFSSLTAPVSGTLILLEQCMMGVGILFSFNQLYSIKLVQEGVDKLHWNPPRKGCLM